MKNILFLSDFSTYSNNALSYALELAKQFPARIILFNSFQIPHSKSNLLVSLEDRLKEDSNNGLQDLYKRIRKHKEYDELDIITESRRGGLITMVAKMEKAYEADLIVMGTKGASELEEMIMGSNAMAVIRATRCPVLAIPEEAKFAGFENILFATDLLPLPEPDQLKPMFTIAKQMQSTIQFLHILRKGKDDMSEEKAAEAARLNEMSGDVACSMHMETNPDVIDGISDYINREEVQVFAMVSRKHSLFERIFKISKTSKLSFRSKVPSLIMND